MYKYLLASYYSGGDFTYRNGEMLWWTGETAVSMGYMNPGILNNAKIKNNDWMGTFGKWNTGLGFGFIAVEKMPGSFRLTNGAYNGSAWSPRYYGSGWTGGSRARISTYNIGKIGKYAGFAGFVVGTGVDFYAWTEGKTSGGKVGVNAAIGLYGFTPVGVIPAALYSGIDNFYPGGWLGNEQHPGLVADQARLNEENSFNPYWQYWPGAMKQ
ncbi:MAG: hypothetical protein DI535_29900 [Citrobacter freundii]|nr:MAG: hypothetical protein DI535_29900 [Citrobacter freundii]